MATILFFCSFQVQVCDLDKRLKLAEEKIGQNGKRLDAFESDLHKLQVIA